MFHRGSFLFQYSSVCSQTQLRLPLSTLIINLFEQMTSSTQRYIRIVFYFIILLNFTQFFSSFLIIIIMNLLKSIIKITNKQILHSFSTKKSNEQLLYYQHRIQSLSQFSNSEHNAAYKPIKPTITIQNFINKYSKNNQSQQTESLVQIICGRISSIRKHGKTTFLDIRQEHYRLQVAIKSTSQDVQYRRGDVVGVKGKAFITKKGELSLLLQQKDDIWVVSPCLWMLPEYEALKDHEIRYRNKHIDLMTNSESVKLVKLRSKIISSLRKELQSREYIEVETPTLSPSCGGAIAKPFVTFHNDHKMSLFMRIAPELFLKRLLIGGIPRVFQIGKNFRNESIDQTHNPQFTSCQLYCAYANYRDMIDLTKQLFCSIIKKSLQIEHCRIKVGDKEIDIAGEWKQIDFIGGLQERTGTTFPLEFQSPQSLEFLRNLIQKHNVACDEPRTAERMLDKLAGHFLEPLSYDHPLLLMHHPKILSPLAKPLEDRPHLTARFQLFIRGWQLLNDPAIQRKNTPGDVEFVQALEYGLMPCAGWGIGIDRLIMLLSQSQRIQQIIIFPLLKDSPSE